MEKINWKKHLKVSATVVALVAGATVVWASGGGHGEAAQHNAWNDVDTWKVLNFVVLALGCFFIARKPVAQFFSSRTKGIEEELTALEQKKAEAERTLAEYQARFRNLEQESEQIVEDYIKQGKMPRRELLQRLKPRLKSLRIWQNAILNKSSKLQKLF